MKCVPMGLLVKEIIVLRLDALIRVSNVKAVCVWNVIMDCQLYRGVRLEVVIVWIMQRVFQMDIVCMILIVMRNVLLE